METIQENLHQESSQLSGNKVYEKPTIEIIEMEIEGSILAGSGENFNPGGGWGN